MNPPEDDFHTRKLEHIKRDYDNAFSSLLKLNDHVNSVRQWNITVMVAYLGVAKACLDKGTKIPILPLLLAIYLFWVMEAFVTALGRFHQTYRRQVDQMFSEESDDAFTRAVGEYRFRSMAKKRWWGQEEGLHRFCLGLVSCQTITFYMLPLAILIVWSWSSLRECTFAMPLPIVLLLPAIGFVLGRLYCRWKYHDR